MQEIKKYKPVSNSVSHGQVLHRPYKNAEARLVLREMAEQLSLEMVEKGLVSKQLVMHIGYDIKNLLDAEKGQIATSGVHGYSESFKGEIKNDVYGRKMPKYARGTINLESWTSSAKTYMDAAAQRFDIIVDKRLLVRRLNITAAGVLPKDKVDQELKAIPPKPEQLNIFVDYEEEQKQKAYKTKQEEKELALEKVMLSVKKKYGKNALLRGMNLQEGATAKDRNAQIGGHRK